MSSHFLIPSTTTDSDSSRDDLMKRANGEGSVFQRNSDGYWVAQVTRREESGPRYRVKYSRDEGEAWEKLEEMLTEEGWIGEPE